MICCAIGINNKTVFSVCLLIANSQHTCFETEKNLYSNLPTFDGIQNRTNLAAVVIAPSCLFGEKCVTAEF
jgi:hypothetical protein